MIAELTRVLGIYEGDEEEKQKYADAIKQVGEYNVPPEPPIDPSTKSKTCRDVLDDVIAMLREEHIKVCRESGPESPRAQELAGSLQQAYAHRSGMVYIRPASAYLRSSYPSTSLQDRPRLAWYNMLGRHALRCLPLVGGAITNRSRREREITSEIDKQFWQNINTVRVSGAGNTNYVIAKDDIGNWYVKAYSADPGPIIQSAKNLALFSLGAEMEVDLLSRLAQRGDAAMADLDLDVARGPLQKMLATYANRYRKQTQEDFERLVGTLKRKKAKDGPRKMNQLESRIYAAWKGADELEPLDEKLKAAADAHLIPVIEEAYKDVVDVETASTVVNTLARSLNVGLTFDVKPILEIVNAGLSDPVRTAKVLDALDKQVALKGDPELQQKFDKFRSYVEKTNLAERIIEMLDAIRRFHNDLVRSIDGMPMAVQPAAAVASAQAASAQAESIYQQRLAEKQAAEEAFNNLTEEQQQAEGARDLLTEAETQLDAAKEERDKAQTGMQEAEQGYAVAKRVRDTVTLIVRDTLDDLVEGRRATIKAYEDSAMLVADAIRQ